MWNRHGHFKHSLRAQRCCDYSHISLPCHTDPIWHDRAPNCEKENSLPFLPTLYLYFPNIPRTIEILFYTTVYTENLFLQTVRVLLYKLSVDMSVVVYGYVLKASFFLPLLRSLNLLHFKESLSNRPLLVTISGTLITQFLTSSPSVYMKL
jgi:hypothetical protein